MLQGSCLLLYRCSRADHACGAETAPPPDYEVTGRIGSAVPKVESFRPTRPLLSGDAQRSHAGDPEAAGPPIDWGSYSFLNIKRYRQYFNVDTWVRPSRNPGTGRLGRPGIVPDSKGVLAGQRQFASSCATGNRRCRASAVEVPWLSWLLTAAVNNLRSLRRGWFDVFYA